MSEEVRLFENNVERDSLDNMAELYAIINALDCLEKMFSRDYVTPKEYTIECSKLLAQIKVALRLLPGITVEEFVTIHRIQCPAALERIREDKPSTVVRKNEGNFVKCSMEVIELFITFLDQLKLNVRATDELYPVLNDLYLLINEIGASLPDGFEPLMHIKKWCEKLREMAAHEEITAEEARQMLFEMETAYCSFRNAVCKDP